MNLQDRSIVWICRTMTYMVVGVILWILLDILFKGVGTLSWEFLTTFPKEGGRSGGIYPAIVGTFWLVLVAMAFALPVGIGCAVYLAEFARSDQRFARLVRVAVTTLAGVPSIVFGLFGLGLFVAAGPFSFGFGESILAGGLTLGCLILPIIIVASEEALRGVPQEYRRAGLALGASRWYTIRHNVFPMALPGMLTGSVLGVGRAAGETAPILFTVAIFYVQTLPSSPLDQVMALPYHLYTTATVLPETDLARPMQYGTATVLILFVLVMNLAAILLRTVYRRRYQSA